MGFRKNFLCSIICLWFVLTSTDLLSLFDHQCPTGCMLLEETTRRQQWKIVYLTIKRGWDFCPSLFFLFISSIQRQKLLNSLHRMDVCFGYFQQGAQDDLRSGDRMVVHWC